MNSTSTMQLVGGLRVGAAAPGDYRFYGDLFARLPKEVSNTGALTRYVAFDHLADDESAITFLGIEVNGIESIPDRMIAWNLGPDALTVMEGRDGRNAVIWQEDVTWQWRNESPSACGRGLTGEFSVRVPGEWSGTGAPVLREFSITANAYVAPAKGGSDDPVQLVDYDPTWPEEFGALAGWLRGLLGSDVALDIEHIGSTAIPGMIAKPILDILVEVPSFREAKQRVLPSLNGETWEYWWHRGHMTFVKRDGFMGQRTHHVHMMPKGDELQNRLAFRDYLRSHPEAAAHYAALKRRLAENHPTSRERYTDAKASFVNEVVTEAVKRS